MLKFIRNQEGDTLIEVLIAIAIVSLILTAAYVITNQNTVAIQGNQERIQAQHLVEAQIESLRANNDLSASTDCFDASGAEIPSSGCGAFTQTGSGATYTAVIVKPAATMPSGTPCQAASVASYTVCVYWTSLDGKKADDSNVTMYYRLN